MNILKNGRIYENIHNEYIRTVDREAILSSFLELGLDTLRKYFKGGTIIPVFRFFLLRDDETIDREISEYITEASYDVNKQNGQIRSMNITILNHDGYWKYGIKKTLWEGMKVRYDCGIVLDNTVYWVQQAVLLVKEPDFRNDYSSKRIQIPLCDKWGLWDGSVYGNTELKTIIPTNVPMNQVFDTIVHENNGINVNQMWDTKEVLFDMNSFGYNTFYTIRQDAGQHKSQLMLDMTKTISSDISYDNKGHLRIKSNVLDFMNSNYSPIWRFEEGDLDCAAPEIRYNRAKYYNKIVTKGAILNGYQFSASIENKNKKSLWNVYDNPINPKVNNNSKLFSDQLCMEQCMYDMVQQSRGKMSVSINCAFLPFLEIDRVIYMNFPNYDIHNEDFIIDGISYSIKADCRMNLKMTSNTEVVF